MIGDTVSHYKITAKLGKGGMGVVYEAENTRLRQLVALKFLPAELTEDADAKTRFVHEAQAASSLQHNHVCTIHDIDQTSDGRLFICMDRYEGGSLRDLMQSGPMDVDRALKLAAQVADGLSAAHVAGITHRDIKPANILLTKDGNAKIADFGLAKLAGRTRVTKSGSTLGTTVYMSPEQTQGSEVDHRSDIWSLGVMLYHMLTGRLPFHADHEAAIAYSIVNTDPAPMSIHRVDLPAGLQPVIDRCLAKNPADRYQSAAELRDDLYDLKTSSRESGGSDRRTTDPRKSRSQIRWLGIAAVIVVAAALVIFYGLQRESGTASAAELSLAIVDFRDLAANPDPVTTAMLTELLNTALVEACPVRVKSPEYIRDVRRRLYGSADSPSEQGQELEIARKAEATYVLTGRIGLVDNERIVTWRLVNVGSGESIGAGRVESGKLSAMVDDIITDVLPEVSEASGISQPVSQVPVERITTTSPTAYEHYVMGTLKYGQFQLEDAWEQFEAAVALDSSFALAYLGLARLCFGGRPLKLDITLAREYADTAWRHKDRLGVKDRLLLKAFQHGLDYEVILEMETLREILDRWPDDKETIRVIIIKCFWWWYEDEAAEISEKGQALYPDDPTIATATEAHLMMGRYNAAYQAAKYHIQKFPDDPVGWAELARSYLTLGFPDSAAGAWRRTFELDPDWGEEWMTECPYHAGDLKTAISGLEKMLSISDLNERSRLDIMLNFTHNLRLPVMYYESGRYTDAVGVLRESRQYVGSDPSFWQYQLGSLLTAVGSADKALTIAAGMEKSDEIRSRIFVVRFKGMAQVTSGDLRGARVTAATAFRLGETIGPFMDYYGYKTNAAIALAENDPAAAIENLEQMKRIMVFSGSTHHLELLDMFAAAYEMAGNLEKAIEVHKETLRIYGGHSVSLYELGRLNEKIGRPADAATHYATFLEMWSEADEDMPQLIDARERYDRLRSGGI
jgi:serine/threonine protein kinase/tetratricopeptide (TPR) repeat protein